MQAPLNSNQSDRPKLPIQAILRKTTDLPALPNATLKVVQLTGGGEATSRSIADAIGLDQALSSKVLRLANSSFYGMPRKVAALNEAVMVLGFRTVRHIALIASAYPWLSKPLPGYDLLPRQLLTHATGMAIAAQMLARVGRFDPDTAFVAGLLADMGKVALANVIEDKLAVMVQLGVQAGIAFDEVERIVIGHSHADVGAHMADNWNLPNEIVVGIRFHHSPSEGGGQWLPYVLHLANHLACSVGCGLGGDGMVYNLDTNALQICSLSADDLDGLLDEFVTAFERAEALFEELGVA